MSARKMPGLPFRLTVVNLAAAGAALVWVAAVGAAVVRIGGEVDSSYLELRAAAWPEVQREKQIAEEEADVQPPPFASLETNVEVEEVALVEYTPAEVEPVQEVVVEEVVAAEAGEVVTFNGRPLRKVRTIRMRVTAYSPDERSCGKWADGITASGYSVWTNGMKLVAADTRILPFHSLVSVPGYNNGKPVPVLDRGGAIKGNRLDVLFPTHEIAMQWGVQWLNVDVWEYAD